MTRKKAMTLGVFTILPFLYFIFFIFWWIRMFISLMIRDDSDNFYSMSLILFPISFAIIINTIVLLVIYLKDVISNKFIEEYKKIVWILILFFGNMIAMPIYWYLNIWKPIKNEGSINI